MSFEPFLQTIKNPDTRRTYAGAMKRFFAAFERPEIVGSDHVKEYLERVGKSVHLRSLRVERAALRRYFLWLIETGHRSDLPAMPSIKMGQDPKPKAAGQGEVERILRSTAAGRNLIDYRDHAVVAVTFYGCARPSVIVGLSLSDYIRTGKRKRLYLESDRILPVHPELERALERYLTATSLQSATEGWFFTSFVRSDRMTGRQLARTDVTRIVRQRAKNAGIKRVITPDMIRNASIELLLNLGERPEYVAEFAGHASKSVTERHKAPSETGLNWNRTFKKLNLDEQHAIR